MSLDCQVFITSEGKAAIKLFGYNLSLDSAIANCELLSQVYPKGVWFEIWKNCECYATYEQGKEM